MCCDNNYSAYIFSDFFGKINVTYGMPYNLSVFIKSG